MTRLDRLAQARLAHAHMLDVREAALAARLAAGDIAQVVARHPFLVPPRTLTIPDADRLRAHLHARYFGAQNRHDVIELPPVPERSVA